MGTHHLDARPSTCSERLQCTLRAPSAPPPCHLHPREPNCTGYDAAFKAVAATLGDRLRLDTPVVEVRTHVEGAQRSQGT